MNNGAARAVVAQALRRVAPEAELSEVAGDAGLQSDLDLDSMDFLNFVSALQELAGSSIPERDYPRLATLDGCLSYLKSLGVRKVGS